MPFIHAFFDNKTGLNDPVFDGGSAHRVYQIHSDKVIEVSASQTEWIEADALVTRTPQCPIGVITADCAPILIAGKNCVAAAHAGWKGALGGVLDKTIQTMAEPSQDLQAYIGPCISQSSYEVSQGFEEPFLHDNDMAEKFFINGQNNKLYFDLAGYCAFRLATLGIVKVHIDGRDTLTHPDFHSHRGGANGKQRNLSAIMLTE